MLRAFSIGDCTILYVSTGREQGRKKGGLLSYEKKLLAIVLAVFMLIPMVPGAALAAGESVTGVSVVDGTTQTPVTVPVVGQKLTANIETSEGPILGTSGNENAQYKWYYQSASDKSLGTGATYTVSNADAGRILCVSVSVAEYTGSATWEADHVAEGKITGVSVVDATAQTPVIAPAVGQELAANITTSDETMNGDLVNEKAEYEWYYQGAPNTILGTEATYIVERNDVGKIICVSVTADNYADSATWEAPYAAWSEFTGVSVVDATDKTPVTTPAVNQQLVAYIETNGGTIDGEFGTLNASYEWYYQDAPDTTLKTDATYDVTDVDLGKILCVSVTIEGIEEAKTWTASGAVQHEVTGVSVVDETDGDIPVIAPVEGQKLAANIATTGGPISGVIDNVSAHYKWYYQDAPETALGEDAATYEVTDADVGKILCVSVTVEGYLGAATWEAPYAAWSEFTEVSVVDATDETPVTIPVVGQELAANIITDGGIIDGASGIFAADYKWYYEEANGEPLGTASTYTVRSEDLGKILCMSVTIEGIDGAKTWTASGAVQHEVTGVSVVDATDNTPVIAPVVNQKLAANIATSDGVILGVIDNNAANYKWYYQDAPDTTLKTDATYDVTDADLGKILCVSVTVTDYLGSATWEASYAVWSKVTGVSVVDGTDGYTPVTIPVLEQKLTANILTDGGTIGSYPVNEDAQYKWYYQDSPDTILGTQAVYTVTSSDIGSIICVEVGIDGCVETATWEASGAVAKPVVPPSGGGGVSSTYAINVETTENGTVTASAKSAVKDSIITLTVKVDTGYMMDSLTAVDQNGNEILLTKKSDTQYTFTMPAASVTVKAVFGEALPFTDVSNHWGLPAIRYTYENEIMKGISNSLFAPDSTLTRGMCAQVLYNMEGSPSVSGNPFDDVAPNAWYANAVNWAAANGIADGYGNGLFGPDDNITREQMAAFLYRYAKLKGYDVSASGDLSQFVDGASTSGWALATVKWAVGTDLLQGKDNKVLDPSGTANRAEVATLIMRFCETIVK